MKAKNKFLEGTEENFSILNFKAVLLIVISGKSGLEMVNLFGDTHEKQINKPIKKNLSIGMRNIYIM